MYGQAAAQQWLQGQAVCKAVDSLGARACDDATVGSRRPGRPIIWMCLATATVPGHALAKASTRKSTCKST